MRTFKYLSYFVIAIIIIFIGINIPDQKLNNDAYKIINKEKKNVVIQGNAYFPIIGMYDKESNIEAAGLTIYNSINKHPLIDGKINRSLNSVTDSTLTSDCFNNIDYNCKKYIQENREIIDSLIKNNKLLLNRYDYIINNYVLFDDHHDIAELDWVYGLLSVHRLFAFNLLKNTNNKTYKHTLDLFSKDILLWRSALSNTSLLITKMIAVAIIQRDINAISEILKSCSNCNKFINSKVIYTLGNEELDFSKVAQNEFIFLHNQVSTSIKNKDENNFLIRFLYNENSVTNSLYFMNKTWGDSLSHNRLDVEAKSESAFKNYNSDDLSWWLGLFYNPVGKTLSAIAMPAYSGYKLAVVNLDFKIAALRNKTQTSANKKNNALIDEFTDNIMNTITDFEYSNIKEKNSILNNLIKLENLTGDKFYKNEASYWKSL